MSWREYWNSDTPIYVNARHRQVHYQRIAEDIGRLLSGQNQRILDFGCGEALAADQLATRCAHLYLCDGADLVRRRLRERLGHLANVTVLAPEELDAVPDRSVDLIVVNSVIQYLSAEEVSRSLAQWRSKLAPSGRLVIADVLPHNLNPLMDAIALLRFAAANGFLLPAVIGLGKTFFSDYRRMRATLGLAHYDEAEMLALLGQHGLSAQRMTWNFGHNPARMAFSASSKTGAAPAS